MDKVNPTWVQDNVDTNEDSNCSNGFKQRDLRHLLNTKKKGKRIEKLISLKRHLKWWNKNIFAIDFHLLIKDEHDVLNSERTFEQQHSEANLIELSRCNAMLTRALAFEEEFWKQKDRCQWIVEGERNTKFFHALVKRKRQGTLIHLITESSRHITSQEENKTSAVKYFQNLLTDEKDLLASSINIVGTLSTKILLLRSKNFSLDLTSREVLLPPPSSLFPKVDDSVYWNNFRPIGLCNVVNKIKSKILCTRLASIIPPMISKTQRGFFKGQRIADNILLATEMVHDFNSRQKAHSLIMKLDMEKAYDRVN
ncbi:uncharacterized protein LOC127265991 [Andrographis paniculata]|uniref:uncharacterized protein LOC127265991 n=1 Tax=Andrographis paniculata TaxID=175694 RepID=UPI0021E901F8|nr:uncharacterized protein LOC127265991 [Andrographis paniculata]